MSKSYRFPKTDIGERHEPSGQDIKSKGNIPATKKRRPSHVKKESNDEYSTSDGKSHLSYPHNILNLSHDDHRYERAPRLLPDISGVHSLSTTEINTDLKSIQSTVATTDAIKDSSAPSIILSAPYICPPTSCEELVATLPACRRAVRITQRELMAMKREREEMEQQYMRMRCQMLWEVESMQRLHRQQETVLRQLHRRLLRKAKSFASSRRRTNALQDLMKEVEVRGQKIVQLTRRQQQLESALKHHELPLPLEEDVYIGDAVTCTFGEGLVQEIDVDNRILKIELKNHQGVTAYVPEEELIEAGGPIQITFTEAENALKKALMDTIEKGLLPIGKEDEYEGEEDEEGEEEEDDDSEEEKSRGKKRKLHGSSQQKKKKKSNVEPVEFTACTIPATPYSVDLMLSPISVLSDRVVACGSTSLQWIPSSLPENLDAWEKDKYESLQLQGEVERLRFQLNRAESEKLEAQQHTSDQLESINQLVQQLEKLREQLAAKDNETVEISCKKGKRMKGKRRSESGDMGTDSEETVANIKQNEADDEAEEDEGGNISSQPPQDMGGGDDEDEDEVSDSASRTRSLRPRRPVRKLQSIKS